jgi:CDP-paratose 2-epimerase
MKILITGVCGFVGSTLARALPAARSGIEIIGLDNFIRPGAADNRLLLKAAGVRLYHGDLRCPSDLEALPKVDWVIDAAANPSVLAGVDGKTSSRQLIEHNLSGTIHLLEFCKQNGAGFTLLSTSRVYSIPGLASLPLKTDKQAFILDTAKPLPAGVTAEGVSETYSVTPPLSLYGASKLTSETLALEYAETFGFPVWINRCGVLAGAGQFGRPDQGIFAYWLNAHLRRRPLKYLGFGGTGHQVRDCLHPVDLVPLLLKQMDQRGPVGSPGPGASWRIANFSGGRASACSLRQLTDWCDARFGPHPVQAAQEERRFDIGWMVLDSSHARRIWGWEPTLSTESILEEIASHARSHPDWLELSAPF